MKKAETRYVWPIDLTKYDRSVEVWPEELVLLRKLLHQEWRGHARLPDHEKAPRCACVGP